MIKFGVTSASGKAILMVGLTDVNLQRLPQDKPISVRCSDFNPPPEATISDAEIVLFHATRETLIEIAQAWDIPEAALLDMLGEG